MAKKTSKQGKKANTNNEKKAPEATKAAEAASKSPVIDKKAEKQGAKATKAATTTPQSPIVDKKADKKTDKPAKQAEKSGKAQQKAPTRAQSKAAKNARQSSKQKKDSIFKRILTYFKNVRLEIKRTTWPSRNEVFRMSLIVVGALLFFGVFIFIIDWAMTRLLEIYANFAPAGVPTGIPEGGEGEEASLPVINYLKAFLEL